ncbi:hypothetical protein FRC03_010845 [Tulasnella sp. 419]|nr:hypothetical protein FRC03_010845 [Tulasnella sp. 419]
MSISPTQTILSAIAEASNSLPLTQVDADIYLTRTSAVAHTPGHRPRVLASLNGFLTRTETYAQFDLPPGEREKSVGVSSPPPQLTATVIQHESEHVTHLEISHPKTGRKRKADRLYVEPPLPRFSRRLRDKAERKKREAQMKLELEKVVRAAKKRKVKRKP